MPFGERPTEAARELCPCAQSLCHLLLLPGPVPSTARESRKRLTAGLTWPLGFFSVSACAVFSDSSSNPAIS